MSYNDLVELVNEQREYISVLELENAEIKSKYESVLRDIHMLCDSYERIINNK